MSSPTTSLCIITSILHLILVGTLSIDAFSPSYKCASSRSQTRIFQKAQRIIVDGTAVFPAEYFKSVYDEVSSNPHDEDHTDAPMTPWDIGGGKPQPTIIKAYKEGKLRGRIIDAGCGAGENCIYLAGNYGVSAVFGCDIAPGAIRLAEERARRIDDRNKDESNSGSLKFWEKPKFFVASCTEMADEYQELFNEEELFDVSIDSGLLHCLSDDAAVLYVQNLAKLVKPKIGRAYVGCFSTKNPEKSWNNPRRLSPEYLGKLFCEKNGWELVSIQDTWWSRPPRRGSSQGAFSMALWMEARRVML